MIKWKFRERYYYFDHVPLWWILLFIFGVPALVYWGNNYSINLYSPWNLVALLFVLFMIYKNCIIEYEPYYFDEFGKKILGVKTES